MFKRLCSVLLTCAALYVGNSFAVGTLIPASGRVDMVHDAARSIVYITDGGSVLRYHVPSATFLAPIALGGQLKGIDLSPDGNTLVVADRSSGTSDLWVYLIRLSDLVITKASTAKYSSYEAGTHAVAYGADGSILVTSDFNGSGWLPIRRLYPDTLIWGKIGTVYPDDIFSQRAMVSASGDGKVIAFAEANISDGRWGTQNMVTGAFVHRTWYENGTSAFNYEIATNANGSQFAIPTYSGTKIYNANYTNIGTIGTYAGPQPIGVAYHPVEPLIYFPWTTTSEIRVYNANSLVQVATYDFENNFQHNGNYAYVQGRTRLSRDGSLLMSTVTGGVRFVQMYAPLSAAPVTGNASYGSIISVQLNGSVGNGGQISYALASNPTKGHAEVSGDRLTYAPAAGATGTDTFRYVAKYGNAVAESTVTISITTPNRAPVAVNDAAETTRNTAVTIAVLSNDSDPDGDPLTITMATSPANGTVAIQAGKIVFTPTRNFTGATSFNYSISDGKGGSASAQVKVTVLKR